MKHADEPRFQNSPPISIPNNFVAIKYITKDIAMNKGIVFRPSFTLPFLITLIIAAEKNDDITRTSMANLLKSLMEMLSPEKLNEKEDDMPTELSMCIEPNIFCIISNNCVLKANNSGAAKTVAAPINMA